MGKPNPIRRAFLFATALCALAMGCISTAVAGEDETEILKITVGKPTKLNGMAYQNSASLAVQAVQS